MNRRTLIQSFFGAVSMATILDVQASDGGFSKSTRSADEWKAILPSDRYKVLFNEATERAGSSPLNKLEEAGKYICAACYLPLFDSSMKFDSGTGWPSFFEVIPNHVGVKVDRKFFTTRTEYHCARCGGHQGHVFDDGPQPTGLRYCNNGLALEFVAQADKLPELR